MGRAIDGAEDPKATIIELIISKSQMPKPDTMNRLHKINVICHAITMLVMFLSNIVRKLFRASRRLLDSDTLQKSLSRKGVLKKPPPNCKLLL